MVFKPFKFVCICYSSCKRLIRGCGPWWAACHRRLGNVPSHKLGPGFTPDQSSQKPRKFFREQPQWGTLPETSHSRSLLPEHWLRLWAQVSPHLTSPLPQPHSPDRQAPVDLSGPISPSVKRQGWQPPSEAAVGLEQGGLCRGWHRDCRPDGGAEVSLSPSPQRGHRGAQLDQHGPGPCSTQGTTCSRPVNAPQPSCRRC